VQHIAVAISHCETAHSICIDAFDMRANHTHGASIMSYPVTLYTDSSRPANSDHRLVVISWKTPQKEVSNPSYKKPPTLCISIPAISITCEPSVLSAAITAAFHDMQNSYLREKINDKSVEQRLEMTFSSQDLSPDAIAAWISSTASGGRLSADRISAWFTSAVSEPLTLLLANKMQLSDEPSAEQLERLQKAIEQRRVLLTKIAGPGTPFGADITKQLIAAVQPAEESLIKQQVLAKLSSYISNSIELEDFI
jgi:hypothetical protein